ncbi:MAG: carbamoyl-phosphate synthase large subunit, partial [Wohlfahrtiimonas sp.]
VFPFAKFPGVDTILGPEMRSTGEVMGVGKTFSEAYLKAQMGAGERIPKMGKVFISVREEDKPHLETMARNFQEQGYGLCATSGTAQKLSELGFHVQKIHKVAEGRPHIVDYIKNGEIAIVVNTVSSDIQAVQDSHSIRRNALNQRVPLYTTLAGGEAVSEGVKSMFAMDVYSVQELHAHLKSQK